MRVTKLRKKQTHYYAFMYENEYGYIYSDIINAFIYTHEVEYKGALYYFGKSTRGTYGLVESETGAFAGSTENYGKLTTKIEAFVEEMLNKEKQSGMEMPQIIQRFKYKINFIDLWETSLLVGV